MYREYADNWITAPIKIDREKLLKRFIKTLQEELRLLNENGRGNEH